MPVGVDSSFKFDTYFPFYFYSFSLIESLLIAEIVSVSHKMPVCWQNLWNITTDSNAVDVIASTIQGPNSKGALLEMFYW